MCKKNNQKTSRTQILYYIWNQQSMLCEEKDITLVLEGESAQRLANCEFQIFSCNWFSSGGADKISKRQDVVLAPFAMGCRYTGATQNAEACNRVADPLEFSLQVQFGSPRCKKCNRIRRLRTSRRERASIQRARKSTSGGGWRWLGGLITGFPTRHPGFEWGKQPVVTVLGKQSF